MQISISLALIKKNEINIFRKRHKDHCIALNSSANFKYLNYTKITRQITIDQHRWLMGLCLFLNEP
jgi:hypothetical protein